ANVQDVGGRRGDGLRRRRGLWFLGRLFGGQRLGRFQLYCFGGQHVRHLFRRFFGGLGICRARIELGQTPHSKEQDHRTQEQDERAKGKGQPCPFTARNGERRCFANRSRWNSASRSARFGLGHAHVG